MQISENAKDDGFWSVIDDGPDEDERDREQWQDLYGDAERRWKE